MAKPMIRGVTAFDASIGYSADIIYSGTVISNKVFVYESDTNKCVINGFVSSGRSYVINPGLLVNGKMYYIGVTITDEYNKESELSDYVFFSCYAVPTFEFVNVQDGKLVTVPFLEAKLIYSQAQGRQLLSYHFLLYEINTNDNNIETEKLLFTSNEYYDLTLSCTYRGLESGKYYSIRAVGSTVDNMVIDTGSIRVRVSYIQPQDDYYVLKVTNQPNCGWIEYKTNVRIIEGEYWKKLDQNTEMPDRIMTREELEANYEYIEDKTVSDSFIDCTDGILLYNRNWIITDDFMMRINFKDLRLSKEYPLVMLYNQTEREYIKLYLLYYEDYEDFVRFRLNVQSGGRDYFVYSDPIYNVTLPLQGSCSFCRKNNLYKLTGFNIGGD